jgi:hypothetical protein
MFINKGKKRVSNLTGSIIAAAIMFPVQVKDTYFRVKIPDMLEGIVGSVTRSQ